MKLTKKLLPALGMLALSACMLVTSTFAWFAMNENVTATGMSVTAKGDQVYLQIMSGSGADIWTDKDGAALPTATAPDATNDSVILPVNAVKAVGETYAGDASLVWVTNIGTSNTNGQASVAYTDVTNDANKNNGKYFVKNTFSIRLDPTAGAEESSPLRISSITTSATADEFIGCLSVLVVSTIGTDVNGQIWKYENGAFANTTTAVAALSDGNFQANAPATIDIYVFFDGDDTDCTQANLAKAGEVAYDISVAFTVAKQQTT